MIIDSLQQTLLPSWDSFINGKVMDRSEKDKLAILGIFLCMIVVMAVTVILSFK